MATNIYKMNLSEIQYLFFNVGNFLERICLMMNTDKYNLGTMELYPAIC